MVHQHWEQIMSEVPWSSSAVSKVIHCLQLRLKLLEVGMKLGLHSQDTLNDLVNHLVAVLAHLRV